MLTISPEILSKAKKIKLLILDVDGVLTDGRISFDKNLTEIKTFHVHDGAGMVYLQRAGIPIAIISGRASPIVRHRMKELNIKYVYQNVKNKMNVYKNLLTELKLQDDEVAYVGDDWPDLPVMLRVGFSVAVANANAEVIKRADWQTTKKGGKGGVREVVELLLKAQGKFDIEFTQYVE